VILSSMLVSVLMGACASPPATPTSTLPVVTAVAAIPSAESAPWPNPDWPVAAPQDQGLDHQMLAQALQVIADRRLDLHSLLIIRHGYLVSETYFQSFQATFKHDLYSVTKSFTATLVGIAVDQHGLRLDAPALGFFPDRQFANLDDRKQAMTVEGLLTMASGLDWQEGDAAYSSMFTSLDWVKAVLDRPMAGQPGREFNYCSGCSHVLMAIVQAQTGQDALAFARQNLFKPLGITDLAWSMDPHGIPVGGWGLNLTPRDMAKLGYLYLHNGMWDGRQIVSAEWVEAATRQHIDAGDLGYGYQWWVAPRLGGYAALGRGGQTVFVNPALDLVVVTTANIDGHEAIFDLIGGYILPAVQASNP
jgi:CubicO group peptidase (beta-lactamase class C family)